MREIRQAKSSEKSFREGAGEISHFSFIPFVAQFLVDFRTLSHSETVSITSKQAMTQESLYVFQEIIRQTSFRFLFFETGWQPQFFLHSNTQEAVFCRCWEHPDFATLHFPTSEASLRLLLEWFNATATETEPPGKKKKEETQEDIEKTSVPSFSRTLSKMQDARQNKNEGDWLTQLLFFRSFVSQFSLSTVVLQRFFAKNPLVLVSSFWNFLKPEFLAPQFVQESIQDLVKSSFVTLFPWMERQWYHRWLEQENSRWSHGLEHYQHFTSFQTTWFQEWFVVWRKTESFDRLLPLLGYIQQLFGSEKNCRTWNQRLKTLLAPLRLSERKVYEKISIDFLESVLDCHTCFQECTDLHPVEREEAHKLYLKRYQELKMDTTIQQIRELIHEIQPKLG